MVLIPLNALGFKEMQHSEGYVQFLHLLNEKNRVYLLTPSISSLGQNDPPLSPHFAKMTPLNLLTWPE